MLWTSSLSLIGSGRRRSKKRRGKERTEKVEDYKEAKPHEPTPTSTELNSTQLTHSPSTVPTEPAIDWRARVRVFVLIQLWSATYDGVVFGHCHDDRSDCICGSTVLAKFIPPALRSPFVRLGDIGGNATVQKPKTVNITLEDRQTQRMRTREEKCEFTYEHHSAADNLHSGR